MIWLSRLLRYLIISLYLYTNATALIGGCEDKFVFVNQRLNWSNAETKCLDIGYDGLPILLTSEQMWTLANLILTERNHTTNTWISLRYKGSVEIWKYIRHGKWVTAPKQTNWGSNQPTDSTTNSCARIVETVFNNASTWYHLTWNSTKCSDVHFPVCQKATSQEGNIGKMTLIRRLTPISRNINYITTRSLTECALLCTSSCFCNYMHYSYGQCRVLKLFSYSFAWNHSAITFYTFGKLFKKRF